ncbi:MAG: CoA transferase [Actinomycetes bacterium]|jgi:crotonobetainyl-CoA:carnitine CoA-transferase CaiB-like acyl-CoA transferase
MSNVKHQGPLVGLKVIDLATVVAGPGVAKYFADYGADVIKVERPSGDSTRSMGWTQPGESDSLWWKLVNRGKRSLVLDLKQTSDLAVLKELIDSADLLIENMRPGKIEQLGLDPAELIKRNPKLVVLRVSGFGQSGPYAQKPGFATIAEALSGLSGLLGEPDGGPLLPPIALTDEVTALVGSFSAMMAIFHAKQTGQGQVVEIDLVNSVLQIMGPLPAAWDSMGYLQPRLGSSIPYSIPRGTYQCSDGVWVALSASAESVARRLIETVGGGGDPRFMTFQSRFENREALEELTRNWISSRPSAEVISIIDAADAAIAPVYSMQQVIEDPHFIERESFTRVDGILMQNLVARMSKTPGKINSVGPKLGEHTEEIVDELNAKK